MSNLTEHLNSLEVAPNTLILLGLGQMGVALKGPDSVIYIDPYLTDSDDVGGKLERNFPPPLEPSEVTNAGLVLCSHNHIDHFDPRTLEPLSQASLEAKIAAPFSCDLSFLKPERRIEARAFKSFMHGSARITPVPSAHTELERVERGYPYLGFVLEWNGVTLYHSGDTLVYERHGDTPGLLETLSNWKFDAAFLPINGCDEERTKAGLVGNMDGREALELAGTLDIKVLFPGHFDLFAFNAADPQEFAALAQQEYPARAFRFLKPGDVFVLEGRAP